MNIMQTLCGIYFPKWQNIDQDQRPQWVWTFHVNAALVKCMWLLSEFADECCMQMQLYGWLSRCELLWA